MTWGKATALAAGFVGAMALGVWVGTSVGDNASVSASAPSASTGPAAREIAPAAAPRPDRAPTRVVLRNVKPTDADLQVRIRPLLNQGADLNLAADGFTSGEQFAAVAHAAHNTGIPFVVLKHRVLEKRMSLKAAIQELKPDLNAAVEANKASAEAQWTVASLQ
jgi:hypothetical protein